MKWTNPGHEYDNLAKRIHSINKVYVYSTDYKDSQYYILIKLGLQVAFVLAPLEKKKSTMDCLTLEEFISLPRENHILLLSKYRPNFHEAIQCIESQGYKRDYDYFIIYPDTRINKFLELYLLYNHNFLIIPSLSLISTTVCNLNCHACLNFTQYNKKRRHMPLEQLCKSVDILFNHVDYVDLFHISGGEPLLYPQLSELCRYIGNNYRENIGDLSTSTNGTIIPSDDFCTILRNYNIHMIIDDYRHNVKTLADKVAQKCNKYNIKTTLNKPNIWIDLAPFSTNYSEKTEAWLIEHFEQCACPWTELYEDKLASCNYAHYAEEAGIADCDDSAYLDLSQSAIDKKVIYEFRSRYVKNGYLKFCKRCAGFNNNPNSFTGGGIQVDC